MGYKADNNSDDAVEAASSAAFMYQEMENKEGEAYALVMVAKGLLLGKKLENAKEEVNKALNLFMQFENAEGEAFAQEVLIQIEEQMADAEARELSTAAMYQDGMLAQAQ